MALNYQIYCDLELEDLAARLDVFGQLAGKQKLWETWSAHQCDGLFHEEIMLESYEISPGFKNPAYFRLTKAAGRSMIARDRMIDFFSTLPGRKLLTKDDVLIDYESG